VVPLVGPAEVHAEEHLGPVGRLGAAGTGADRQDRGPGVVGSREQELRPLAVEVTLQGQALAVALGPELGVTGFLDQLAERLQLGRPGEEAAPALDVGPQAVRLAEDRLGGPLVVPESGRAGQALELGEAPLSCG
jgi:hypothetical protein